MAGGKSRKFDFNSLPPVPQTTQYYGSNTSGEKEDPATYSGCDLVMTGVFPGTWETLVPKYVQLSDRMVGNALMRGIAATKLADWYQCDFVLTGRVLGLRPGRQSSGHPSLDITGKVHLAFGQYLVEDSVHNVDVASVGFVALGHAATQETFAPINASLDSLRRIHQAFGVDLAGDPIHNVDVAKVGWVALTHATLGYTVRPYNDGIEKVLKIPQPYTKVRVLLTCDKYYVLKSTISAGDAQTENTSCGGSAKKRKTGSDTGSSELLGKNPFVCSRHI
jgi:hypothetical protein